MRIVFFQEGLPGWMAGFTYLANLMAAIRLTENPPECYLLLRPGQKCRPTGADSNGFIKKVLVWPASRPVLEYPLSALSTKITLRPFPDKTLNGYLEEHEIDAAFGSWWQYPEPYAFPALTICSWIHDFQFVHLPELYDPAELPPIHRGVNRMIAISKRVVVSSQAAFGDLLDYAPGAEHKSRVLRFAAAVPPPTYDRSSAEVADSYHIPSRFLYLPNQFWKHKNHSLLLEALLLLKKRQIFPKVVCTGQTFDLRDPYYYAGLVRKVAEYDLHDQIHILGIVPIEDVRRLIRQSVCVLNPSRFEGWSSTVEEAKSIGKRVILSDLPVHREQSPPGGVYFSPKDAEDLALKIETAWKEWPEGPDPVLEEEARKALPGRMSEFGRTFLTIMEEAIREGKGGH